ncbi:MAG TPA: hypothetical protein VN176_14345 [Verrucomicrobiae bacterium]|jgi:uncharacterized repeat protein (TIGR01451 family)|nr:hypothetical protein [Verrucomicrobiae bacterium]
MRKTYSILVCLLLGHVAAAIGSSTPPGTSIDNQASATFSPAAGSNLTATSNVVHVITQNPVGPGAALSVNKSVSKTTAAPGDQLTFTLNLSNTGSGDAAAIAVTIDGSAANRILLRDVVPNNTRFTAFLTAGVSTPLYHISGAPLQTYVSAAPADLSTVDAIAFALDTFTAGAAASFSFQASVNNSASGMVRNTGTVFYNNGSDTSAVSNEVDVTVNGPSPTIAYFFDGTFSKTIQATPISSQLWIQISAAACNLDPTAIESKPITLKSTLTGDTETFTATETGPNTGVFRILPAVPMRDASVNPVVSGNKIMEVLRNDQIVASLSGCGAATVTATVLIDPAGVVFDSHSNAPVAGANVTLIDVTGNGNGGHPNSPANVFQFDGVTPAPSSVVTGSNGQFQFPQVLPSTYRFAMIPPGNYKYPSSVPAAQLPPGRHIDPSASYNGSFVVASATANFDLPLDASANSTLFVQKTVDRGAVEQGEFVNYTLQIKNLLSITLPNVQVTDTLPPGFAYQAKTARLNGVPMSDPAGGKGPTLTFNIGNLDSNADVKLTYRVFVGPGSGVGNAVNRAYARSGSSQSNTATAQVVVQSGLFINTGFIVGKVFQDCNGNHIQDRGELGVPGVRVYLDDGTFAITDDQGKYSMYGVSGRTHMLKVDMYSLPEGVKMEAISSRNAGDGNSRFIDLKFGDMQKADFAIANCSSAMVDEIKQRAQKKDAKADELARGINAQFNAQTVEKSAAEVKGLAASGFVAGNAAAPGSGTAVSQPVSKVAPASSASDAGKIADASAEFAKLDNDLGFVDLHDQDILPFAQTRIRIKGMQGNNFKVLVNGTELSPRQVGTKTMVANRQLEIWEFVGVNLLPGKNKIEVSQTDPWGNNRGTQSIEVVAPSKLGKLRIETSKNTYPADGRTPVKVTVRLTDTNDVPVTVRTPITLEATNGVWLVKDLDPKEPGTQVFIEGAHAEFELMPPMEPGSSMLRVSSGGVSSEARIEFVPELRPMTAAGIVQYQVNFGGMAHNAIQPSLNDGFANQLQTFSVQNADGSVGSGGHAALFLKGKIKGDTLITLAYDSDKTSGQRLFRDIQPDQYYPVYGDSSIRGYDAQSTSKAYVRVDHGQTYVLYGDYLTAEPGVGNSLGNYSRSMTGVKEHFENDRVNLTGFASYDTLRQVVEELPANGTSGPFTLSNPNGVENSEKVEVLTRDRNQPAVIIDIKQLSRFTDYEFEPFTGQLLLKAPVPTLDFNLNPMSLRVTYEVNQGGQRFWVGGGAAQVKLANRVQVGGTFVDDSNPADPNKLFAVNTGIKLLEKTFFRAEFAGTQHDSEGTGMGYRFELQHDGDKLKTKAYFARTDVAFDNPTSIMNKGRGEAGVKANYALNSTLRLNGEFIRTEDALSGGTLQGGEVDLQKSLRGNIQTSFGFRHAEQGSTPANSSSIGITPNAINSVLTKFSMQIPHYSRLTASGEYEQDISNLSKRVLAVGGTYQFWTKGKVYFRQELISSLGDVYSLNSFQHRNTTQIGIDTNYYKNAHVFSEYRIHDLASGREAEAAIGLRNQWTLAKGFTANTSVESIRTLNGVSTNALALTGAVEYTAHDNWKGSARMEWRGSSTTSGLLSTLGFAARLTDSWTFLGRNVFSTTTTKGSTGGTHLQDRMQFGFALRDAQMNRWNALSLFEVKADNDNATPASPTKSTIGIFSTTANYQVSAPLTFSARYAAKWSLANGDAIASSAVTQLVGGRAMWDVTRKWDFGVASSTTYSSGFASRQYAMGFETGYQVVGNLWVSSGYNLVGFSNADLTGEDVTRKGPFIRLRFKFDERIFSPREKAHL